MLLNRGNLQLNNEAIIARCYEFLENHELTDTDSKFGKLNGRLSTVIMAAYLTKNDLIHLMPHNWLELAPLVEVIKKQSNHETFERSWFNILPTNTDLDEHSHIHSKNIGAKYGSFVYYPQLTENDIPIELLINDEWVPVTAKTGDWICFDLGCVHRVPLNTTDHHRISFAFNI